MSSKDYETEIAEFIRTKGITRCPTACVAPTHASGSTLDRAALRQRATETEAKRRQQARQAWVRAIAVA